MKSEIFRCKCLPSAHMVDFKFDIVPKSSVFFTKINIAFLSICISKKQYDKDIYIF